MIIEFTHDGGLPLQPIVIKLCIGMYQHLISGFIQCYPLIHYPFDVGEISYTHYPHSIPAITHSGEVPVLHEVGQAGAKTVVCLHQKNRHTANSY